MASIKKNQDLKVWQESRVLAQKVFEVILSNPDIKDYPFKDQINRSSGSIMDNIAEGFGRKGNKEFRQFLTNTNGSNEELQSQLFRAQDRNYITQECFDDLLTRSVDISKMCHGTN